jgi:hypothetical protein
MSSATYRSRIFLVLLCSQLLSGGAARAQDNEQELRDDIYNRAYWAMQRADFAELERMHAASLQGAPRTPAGYRTLNLVRGGIGRAIEGPDEAATAYHVELDKLTRAWADANRDSPLAQNLHAESLVAHAWHYRGSGYSNTVPPDSWREFKNHAQRAADFLAERRAVASRDSWSHGILLRIGRALDWGPERARAIVREGLALDPQDGSLRFQLLTTLLPKWNGDARMVDHYINSVAAETRARDGMIWYAVLYGAAADDHFSHKLFEDSAAEWSKMKAGFEDLLRRYPGSYNANRFAYFACLARDKPTFLEQMSTVGDAPLPGLWGSNGARTVETCRTWGLQS